MKGLLLALVLAVPAWAQDTAAPKGDASANVSAAKPDVKPVPTVPDDVRNAGTTMQMRAAGLQEAIAILQKELDALGVSFSRLVQSRVPSVDGYDVDTQTWRYVPKPPKR